jgi:hypothetical protein
MRGHPPPGLGKPRRQPVCGGVRHGRPGEVLRRVRLVVTPVKQPPVDTTTRITWPGCDYVAGIRIKAPNQAPLPFRLEVPRLIDVLHCHATRSYRRQPWTPLARRRHRVPHIGGQIPLCPSFQHQAWLLMTGQLAVPITHHAPVLPGQLHRPDTEAGWPQSGARQITRLLPHASEMAFSSISSAASHQRTQR